MTNLSLEEAGTSEGDSPTAAESAQSSGEHVCALEAFPAILKKISMLWGTRELDKLIQDLILDSRGGARQGFPMETAHELLFLAECNKHVRALDVAKNMNISHKEAFRMVDSGDQAHLPTNNWNDPSVSQDVAHHQHHSNTMSRPFAPVPEPAVRYDDPDKGLGLFFWIGLLFIFLVVIKLLLDF